MGTSGACSAVGRCFARARACRRRPPPVRHCVYLCSVSRLSFAREHSTGRWDDCGVEWRSLALRILRGRWLRCQRQLVNLATLGDFVELCLRAAPWEPAFKERLVCTAYRTMTRYMPSRSLRLTKQSICVRRVLFVRSYVVPCIRIINCDETSQLVAFLYVLFKCMLCLTFAYACVLFTMFLFKCRFIVGLLVTYLVPGSS